MANTTQIEEASAGDVIVIAAHHLGEPEQLGEILEILSGPGRTRYRVRWDDGHESVFYPGSDATIRHARSRRNG